MYLAVILDVFSRRIVGWSMDKRMTDTLAVTAFKNALVRRRTAAGLITTADQTPRYYLLAQQRKHPWILRSLQKPPAPLFPASFPFQRLSADLLRPALSITM
ncbi:DDE-type integrase/transposase/recombinase [Geobacter sp. SVR]|uniref:DDE-type integrase/transposase/recombinase n=1 Tax=Geobacter sp. SVR TaxID=2495594 RepID=UPI00351C0DF5